MIALFALILAITCFGLVAAWLAENPGTVTIFWFDYRIDMSFAGLLLAAFVAALLVTFSYLLIRKFVLAPKRFLERRTLKCYRDGMSELTYSVAALAASDLATAEAHTRKAEKLLGRTPLTLLLSAQIAKNHGDETKTRALLEQLLEHKETEYLAAKSLADAAGKQQLFPQALAFAKRANSVNPKDAQAAWALFEVEISMQQWEEAAHYAAAARKKGAFSRADYKRAQGLLALRQGQQAARENQRELAAKLAREAVSLMPNHEETIVFASEFLDAARIISLIQNQWKTAPSKALAEIYGKIIDEAKPAKQEKLIKQLIAKNPTAAENALL